MGMFGLASWCTAWLYLPSNPFAGHPWKVLIFVMAVAAPCTTVGIFVGRPKAGFAIGLVVGTLFAAFIPMIQIVRY